MGAKERYSGVPLSGDIFFGSFVYPCTIRTICIYLLLYVSCSSQTSASSFHLLCGYIAKSCTCVSKQMYYRTTVSRSAVALLLTPLDYQPTHIPHIPSTAAVMNDIRPAKGEMSRSDEVRKLLEELPRSCDTAKQLLHDSQYASKYYRARFSRGMEGQRKQATEIAAMSSHEEVEAWARGRLCRIADPFRC